MSFNKTITIIIIFYNYYHLCNIFSEVSAINNIFIQLFQKKVYKLLILFIYLLIN
jgi:hypothetical protein